MLKIFFIGLIVLVAVFAVIVFMQPDHFRVERSITLHAPTEVVFEQVNNLRNWNTWSPWAKLDPNAKNIFEGPDAGEGAKMSWAGNSEVGEGSMTITDTRTNEMIRFRLDFVKPFKGTNTVEFAFLPDGTNTRVTWAMYGNNNFIAKAIGLIMNCDKMIGDRFEEGLNNLKQIVEK